MSKIITISIEADGDDFISVGDVYLKNSQYGTALEIFKAAAPKSGGGRSKIKTRLALLEKWQAKDAGILAFMVENLLSIEKFQEQRNLGQVYVGYGLISFQKNQGFLNDARLLELSEKHSHLLPVPGWHWNLHTVLWAISHALKLPGDFVELGVFKGHTTKIMAEYFDFGEVKKSWYLYDTFEGIPEDQLDSDRWRVANEQTYKNTYSYEAVREEFVQYPNINVIKGRVPEILENNCPKQIAFMHVDLNNTKAEIAALDFLFDTHMVPGGVVLFDDFGWLSAHMQFAAENAWAEKRSLKILELPTGQGLLLKPAS